MSVVKKPPLQLPCIWCVPSSSYLISFSFRVLSSFILQISRWKLDQLLKVNTQADSTLLRRPQAFLHRVDAYAVALLALSSAFLGSLALKKIISFTVHLVSGSLADVLLSLSLVHEATLKNLTGAGCQSWGRAVAQCQTPYMVKKWSQKYTQTHTFPDGCTLRRQGGQHRHDHKVSQRETSRCARRLALLDN